MFGFFFSYRGRIGRLGYLGRMIALFVVFLLLTAILGTVAFTGMRHSLAGGSFQGMTANMRDVIVASSARSLAFFYIIYVVILFAVGLAAGFSRQVRRLHDIGLSGWIVLAPFAMAIVPGVILGIMRGQAMIENARNHVHTPPPHNFTVLWISSGIINLIFFLLLVLCPGTKGENKYGDSPNPLYRGGKYSSSASERRSARVKLPGKRIIATLHEPVPEDQLAMMSIIRQEHPDIEKIFVSPERDRIEFTLSSLSHNNRKSIARILKDFGFTIQSIEMG